MPRRLVSRLRHLFGAARSRKELDEEMSFHVDLLTEDLVRQGMDPKEARRQARIRFGSPERVHARAREERGLALIDETERHVRLAIRGLARSPLFATTFILTLALCIGLGTTAFSVVDAALLRPLPYPAPDRLANAVLYSPTFGKSPFNVGVDGRTWERIRDQGEPFERAVYDESARGVNLTTDQASVFVRQQRVGAGFFGVLGHPPLSGREFSEAEDVPDGPAVAILSHDLWTSAFGGASVLGETIRLKGEAHTVVGIMPPDFRSEVEADLWTPLRASSTTREGAGVNYRIVVRIPEGMSFGEADARLAGIETPASGGDDAPERRFGLVPLDAALSAGVRLPMLLLIGAIVLMLVVGCANLAGLQIARSLARAPEMATRQALGSGTGAMVRQAIVENLVLGLAGGVVGLAVAYVGIGALEGVVRSTLGLWEEIRLDGRALVAAAGITTVATVLFGLAPVVQAGHSRVRRLLVSGSRVVGERGHALRKVLLVGQVAMVTVLLFSAGLLVRSYGHLQGLDPGFDAEGALAVQLSLDDARYAEAEAVRLLFDESLGGIRRIPGVSAAAVSLTLPYERALNSGFRLPGDGDDTYRLANVLYVTPGYFETLGIPVLQGRAIEEADREDAAPVVVVDQAWVDANLEGGAAVGTQIVQGFAEGTRVIGVVGNVQQAAGWGANTRPVWETPTVYIPVAQVSGGFLRQVHVWYTPSWIIRASGSPAEVSAQVWQVFGAVVPDVPLARISSLEEVMSDAFARQRFEAAFLLAVAALALLLAGIGLYGVVAHEVLERRSELGLRMALGSTPGGAVWTVGANGVRLTLLGLVAGALVAVWVGRVMERLIWGVTPSDPVTLVALVAVLAVLAGVASFLPAARVSRMDPARILRDA